MRNHAHRADALPAVSAHLRARGALPRASARALLLLRGLDERDRLHRGRGLHGLHGLDDRLHDSLDGLDDGLDDRLLLKQAARAAGPASLARVSRSLLWPRSKEGCLRRCSWGTATSVSTERLFEGGRRTNRSLAAGRRGRAAPHGAPNRRGRLGLERRPGGRGDERNEGGEKQQHGWQCSLKLGC